MTIRDLVLLVCVIGVCGLLHAEEPSTPATQPEQRKFVLQERWQPGTYLYTEQYKSEIEEIWGEEPSWKENRIRRNVWRIEVSEPNKSGQKTAIMTCVRTFFKVTDGSGNLQDKFDSEATAEKPLGKEGRLFSAIHKIIIKLKIDEHEKVIEVKGIDEMLDRLAETEPDLIQKIRRIRFSWNNESMKKHLSRMQKVFLKKPVGVGDAWSVEDKPTGPIHQNSISKSKYKLIGIKKQGDSIIADIEYTTTTSETKDSTFDLPDGVKAVRYAKESSHRVEGKMLWNVSKSRLVSSSEKNRMKAKWKYTKPDGQEAIRISIMTASEHLSLQKERKKVGATSQKAKKGS